MIRCCSLATVILAASFAGCSDAPEMTVVEGKVLYQGEPLSRGAVMFQPEQGQPSQAMIAPDGTFRMETFGYGDGAVVGHNRVRIVSFEGEAAEEGEAGGLGRSLIPKRYGNYSTSGLEIDIQAGHNEPVVFELSD